MVISKLKNKQPVTLAFLGDSVTQGCFEVYYTRAGSLEPVYRPLEAYPQKLSRLFGYFYPDTAVNIMNYGISGNTARQGLERIDDMLMHRPDAVVVCFGLNDSNLEEVGVEAYRSALSEIFDRLSGIQVIFMTPNPLANRISDFICDSRIMEIAQELTERQNRGVMDQYMDCARSLCSEREITICDCYQEWKRLEQGGVDIMRLMSNDLNHPTEEMHWLFAIELFKTFLRGDRSYV